MTMFQTQHGELRSANVILSSTGATALFAALTDTAVVEFVQAAEVSGNTPTLILDVFDGTSVLSKIRGTKALVANTPERVDGPFVIEPGWTLRGTASSANQVHLTATYFVIKT